MAELHGHERWLAACPFGYIVFERESAELLDLRRGQLQRSRCAVGARRARADKAPEVSGAARAPAAISGIA